VYVAVTARLGDAPDSAHTLLTGPPRPGDACTSPPKNLIDRLLLSRPILREVSMRKVKALWLLSSPIESCGHVLTGPEILGYPLLGGREGKDQGLSTANRRNGLAVG
jgi:hypothetical protein